MSFVPIILVHRRNETLTTRRSSSVTNNCNQTSLLLYGGNINMEYNNNDTIKTYSIYYDGYAFSTSTGSDMLRFSKKGDDIFNIINGLINYNKEIFNLTTKEFNLMPIKETDGYISQFLLFLKLS